MERVNICERELVMSLADHVLFVMQVFSSGSPSLSSQFEDGLLLIQC